MLLRGLLLLFHIRVLPRLLIGLLADRRVPLGLKLIVPAAIAYFISPIDVVPDLLPVLGHIDDIVVLLMSVVLFLGLAPKDAVGDHLRNLGTRRSGGGSASSKKNVIDGKYRILDEEDE